MTNENQIYFGFVYCLLMFVLSILFLKFPPKKINGIYGYRTARSMKNQETWDAANSYWTTLYVKGTLVTVVFPIITYVIYPKLIVLITVLVEIHQSVPIN